MNEYIVACIFARGGSKGVPRKNIRLLAGKPLIAYSIETAKQIKRVSRVVVSTDDAEIADIAKAYGAEVPFMRPDELATDASPEWLSWQHAVRTLNEQGPQPLDIMLSLPTTSPLRETQDVEHCLDKALTRDFDLVVAVHPALRHPYYNMMRIDETGEARIAITPPTPVHRRQDAPVMYDLTTVVYAAQANYVLTATRLMQGKLGAIVVEPGTALDIDSELDLEIADYLMKKRLGAKK